MVRKNSNRMKSDQLGLNHSTAQQMLRKKLLFHLVQKCGLDTCIRCGKPIIDSKSLSIDHIKPWLYSNDPAKLFFDVENIGFSHTFCNYSAKRLIKDPNTIGKSGYKGVYYQTDNNRKKKWRAVISYNDKLKTLGYYTTSIEAARAYDKASVELHSDRGVTNKSLGLL